MTTPQSVAQLRSFLGLANYCARFIKDFATISAPLNELTKKSTKWQWTVVHQQAFEKIKTAIAEDCSMAFYDPAKETTLNVDATPVGLGAILSQIQEDEKEALAVKPVNANTADKYINIIVPKSMALEEIAAETSTDSELQAVIKAVQTGHWYEKDDANCSLFRHLAIAHEGHQGKGHLVKSCLPCQSATILAPQPKAPLIMTDVPSKPWSVVYADFCGPFPNGETALVVIDGYSRYMGVEIMKNFDAFLNQNGVRYRKITPYWPQANAEAERFMRTLEKVARAAHFEGRKWQDELDTFLVNYRSTPHCTTGISPAELLFNRKIRNKLPSVDRLDSTPCPQTSKTTMKKLSTTTQKERRR
ncbi:uncharacterized protein K02A2.6-like [Paramuricea clavata]|uniref:Uncharacterized protein K02A2.6-like n=1 Tax=Paramuricea clavata TaxID=317549 RepID=A0A6S7JTR1_PARCT|nr:uncharacterized protein K02A2.6-like [Paramuricea clavata]